MASITRRSNSYRIMASAGRTVDGHQIRPNITWKPEPGTTDRQIKKELERIRIDFERRVENGDHIWIHARFSKYAKIWLDRRDEGAEKPLAPKTYERYRYLLQRINAEIGHIKLVDLQPQHIRDFLKSLRKSGNDDKVICNQSLPLKDMIASKGYTLRRLASVSSISASTVCSACKGITITNDSAKKISKTLGFSLDDLFIPVNSCKKLSDRTILHYYMLISAILTAAVVDDGVLQANPIKRVRPPHVNRLEAEYLDEHQAAALLKLLESEPIEYRIAVRLLLFTGMRRGEALGLKWSNVDTINSTIRICQSTQYLPGKGIFQKAPKNDASIRTIKVSNAAIESLEEYQEWQNERRMKMGDLWQDGDWVFTTWNGKPMNPDTLSSWFRTVIQKTDLKGVHLHTLRHTNAALLIAGGENLRTVSRRLGHSQTSTTLNIYSHVIESTDARAAQTLENILDPVPKAQQCKMNKHESSVQFPKNKKT